MKAARARYPEPCEGRHRAHLFSLWSCIFMVAAVLVLPPDVSSHASAAPVDAETFVYKISRTRRSAGPLEASVTLEWEGDGSHLMMATLDRRKGHNRLSFGTYAEAGVDLWPRVHHQGSTGPSCLPSPLCTFPLKQPLTLPIPGEHADVAFVASVGLKPHIDIESKGWKVRPLSPVLFQVVNESTDDSTGVRFTGNYSLSRFTHADLPGGPFGSLAFASIPCKPNEGLGEAMLEGGVPWPAPQASDRFFCVDPDLGYYLTGFALAETETSWSLDGDVVGSGSFYDGRLAVFSFPPRTLPVRPAPGA